MTTFRNQASLQPQDDARADYYWDRVRRHGKRYPKFHWPSVELILSFLYTYDVLATHFTKRIGRYGLSLSAFNVLMILRQSDRQGLKQHELSRLMLVSRANITGLIDSLVRRGLVSRGYDRKDRRVCMARITARGEALLEALLPSHYEEIARLTGAISAADKTRMKRLLGAIQLKIGKTHSGKS